MSVTADDLAIDRELADIAGMIPYLRYVTPTNVTEARRRFADGAEPVFEYRPLPHLDDVAARLAAVNPDEAVDPTVRHMARALKRELELRIDLLGLRGTPRFFLAAVELFGHVEVSTLDLALDLLATQPDEERVEATIGAEALAERAREEIARYRARYPELAPKVVVSDHIAGVMVENGDLYIGSDVRVAVEHVPRLLHHEVGVHVLTYVNGAAQPLRMLAVGLAGYDETQEALGVLAEHLSGGLPPVRLRILAHRVVAAQMRSDGAGFRETYDRLVELGASPSAAFSTTMRAHRAGGMTKDAVYLRGLDRLCEHLAGAGSLDGLFIGKVALEDEPLVAELAERGVLVDPPLRPRFLDTDSSRRRLAEAAEGGGVRTLAAVAA